MSNKTGSVKTEKELAWEKRRRQILRNRLLLAGAAVVLILGAVLIWNQSHSKMEPNVVVGPMPGMTQEQLQAELNAKVAESLIAYTINEKISCQDARSPANILFENPANNEKLLTVSIYMGLDDTGELLYKSKFVQPGSYIPEAPLLVELEPGEYDCTAYIRSYRFDESYIGRTTVDVKVCVLT